MNIAVQLYSIRESMAKDFLGTLEKVSQIGYQGVEFAGFGGFSAVELKAHLERLNLKPVGAHIGLEELKNNLDSVIEYNLELGNKWLVCPWASYENEEDFTATAALLEDIGSKAKKAGLQLCYHNHAHELKNFSGVYGLDIIFGSTSPEHLATEVDTYWVAHAGLDPVEYIKKYTGRSPLIHIKDMSNKENRESTEIGNGIIDIEGIAAQAKANGTEWLIVEQEAFDRDPMESIAISLENLKKMQLV